MSDRVLTVRLDAASEELACIVQSATVINKTEHAEADPENERA